MAPSTFFVFLISRANSSSNKHAATPSLERWRFVVVCFSFALTTETQKLFSVAIFLLYCCREMAAEDHVAFLVEPS